jgi:lantibiotic modifying enzyme
VLIRFSQGQAVVYKPVSLLIDHLLSSVLEVLNDVDGRTLFHTLEYLPAGADYGFVRFADAGGKALGKRAADRFFFRFGALVAAAYALNITDMHMENVLAVGEHPVLIDFETALYRFPDDVRPTDVTSTGLVERKSTNVPNSGIQGGGACRQWALHPLREHGRDILGYRRPHFHIGNRQIDAEGQLIEPSAFSSSLVEGFDHGYRLLWRSKGLLRQLLEDAETTKPRVRHIIRFTSQYLVRYFQLLQPSGDSMDARKRVLRVSLEGQSSALEHPSAGVLESEVSNLLRGDVPYFWSALDSCNLNDRDGVVQGGCFCSTPLEALLEQLDQLSASDLRKQRSLLEETLQAP